MRQLLVHVLVCALVLGFPGALSAGDLSWIGQRGEKKWKPHFEVSLRSGNHDRHGLELDPLIPIAQDDRSLWFLNLRNGLFWVDNDFAHEINVGGGYRRIMGESWILGGYGFFDRIQTRFDNHFNQGTLGLEALSLNWDLRFNGYIADNETKSASGAGGGGVQLVGTTLSMNSAVEQALSGFDGELGWRLPFAPNSLLGDTRLYAGGFFFEASDVEDIGGPRTRFEMRIHDIPFLWEGSRITLGTEYTWDDVRSSEVTSLVSLRIPFGAPSRSESLTPLERRMTDRVVRDVSVVTNLGGGSEPVQNEAGVVIGETLFFDSAGGGDGSFASPLDLPTAIPTGAENALLIGLDGTGDITGLAETLLDGQTVLGGGTSILLQGVNSGNTALFTPQGSPATFSGGGAPTLTLASNNTVSGLTFRSVSEALRLDQSGGSSITSILGNTFDTVGVGIDATLSGSFDGTLNLRGNTFQGGSSGLLADLSPDGSSGPSSFDLAVDGNSFDSLSTAVGVNVSVSGSEDYSHRSAISNNVFSFNDSDYELDFDGGGASGFLDVDVAVDSNLSTGAGGNFTNVYVGSISSGHVDLQVTDNDIEGASDTAIEISLYDAPDFDGTISDNQIDTVDGDGIRVESYGSGSLNGHTLTINNNALQYVYGDGIDVYFGGGYYVGPGYDATVTIADNTIQYADGHGIGVDFYGNGHAAGNVATINGNTIRYVNGDGIDVYFGYGYDGTATIADNTIQYADGHGIGVDFYRNGHAAGNVATINGNTIGNVYDDAIDVYFGYGYDGTATIADNTVQYADGHGIAVEFYANGYPAGNVATINGNSIQYVYGNGIDVYLGSYYGFGYGYNYDATVTITDNTIQDVVYGDGIYLYSYYNGHDQGNSATISRNTIQNVFSGDGIDVYFGYGYDATLTIADNIIQYADGRGIAVDFTGNGHAVGNVATINGNAIRYVYDDGIDVYFGYGYDGTVTIADNTVQYADGHGIAVEFYANGYPAGNVATINGNSIQYVYGNGIDVYLGSYYGYGYGYDANVTITDNTIQDVVYGDGIYLYSYYNGHDQGNSATISRNTIQNVFSGDGIDVYFGYGYDATLTIADNTIQDVGTDGIRLDSFYNGHDQGNSLTINGNAVTNAGGDGIGAYVYNGYYGYYGYYYGYDATLTIADNTIDQSGEYGIDVYADATTELSSDVGGSILDNVVTNSGIADVYLYGSYSGSLRVNGVDVP